MDAHGRRSYRERLHAVLDRIDRPRRSRVRGMPVALHFREGTVIPLEDGAVAADVVCVALVSLPRDAVRWQRCPRTAAYLRRDRRRLGATLAPVCAHHAAATEVRAIAAECLPGA